MPSREHRWCGERGQSTALVASMLFVLTLFVAIVANVGQAVNRRIALQIVADAGAYTGASVMATGLNQLAFWNAALQYTWAIFTFPVASPVYFPFQADQLGISFIPTAECDTTEGWIGFWNGLRGAINAVYTAENVGYGQLAHSEATSASDFNAADLLPGEHLEYAEFDSLSEAFQDPLGVIPPARSAVWLDDSPVVDDGTMPKAVTVLKYIPFAQYFIIKSQKHLNYSCLEPVAFPPFVIYRDLSHDFITWYRKSDGVKSFVWIVKAPAVKALMFDSVFGGTAIPEMRAAAVAKPIGGEIEAGKWDYIAKMMPLATVMAGNRLFGSHLPSWLSGWTTENVGRVSDPNYDRGSRIVTH